jgi:hypothetical protein
MANGGTNVYFFLFPNLFASCRDNSANDVMGDDGR